MKRRIAVLTFMFLLSFFISPLSAAETRLIYNLAEEEGLTVEIYAPRQAYPNDNMTIRITVEARTEELRGVTVSLKIYGSMREGYNSWLRILYALDNEDLDLGEVRDQYFDVNIPESADPGILHGHVSCSWKVFNGSLWQENSIDDVCIHMVTYLKNKPYEELQVAYNQLLADYNTLLGNYSVLQANYSALQSKYNQLLADYDSLQTSYDDLENSHSDLQANYTSLQSHFNSLQEDYDNLQTNYCHLNSTYHQLLSNYSSLQADLNELKSRYEFGGEIANTLNLTYVFIETTVIFIATTMYYARSQISSALRKLKPREEKAVDVDHGEQQQP